MLAGFAAGIALEHRARPAPEGAEACQLAAVQVLGRATLAAGDAPDNNPIGGISGIAYDERRREYLVITDGRGQPGAGRIGRLTISASPSGDYAASWLGSAEMLTASGHPFARPDEAGEVADGEALRIAADGTLLWTSEGDGQREQGPGLYRLKRSDWRSHPIALSPVLRRDPVQRSGPRDNQSIEGLWLDGADNIWLGIEAPLIEDGPVPDQTTGALARIMRIDQDGKARETWHYPLEAAAGTFTNRLTDNGLSEILGLGNGAFLVLERSGMQQEDGSFQFLSRLFCAAPVPGSSVLAKRELATFEHADGWHNANFEGLTFGPSLPDGRTMLVLSADNNFEDGAPSIFAILAFQQ